MIPEVLGYAFPNDIHILWSLMIVTYPYVTGLVAGAFIVSSLYHVFGRKQLWPIGRFSLVASLAFMLVATWPLLNHLGHPERAFNIMVTPNPSSAMAGFGLAYNWYLMILVLEVWFVFRKDIVVTAQQSRGLKRFIFSVLALRTYDISEEALRTDHKIVTVLAAIGIPSACFLHGYVGFLFGAFKANPWWSTPLMPIIFLFSAVVSGIAAMILMYQAAMALKGLPILRETVATMASWLWLFMILTVTLELLEIITLSYESDEAWVIIRQLLTTRLSFSFFSLQLVFGSLIPFILLMIVVLMGSQMKARVQNILAGAASGILLIQVFSMRWNVVVGGQLFSKSLRGLRSPYQPQFFEKEGILPMLLILIAPFVILVLFEKVLPMFRSVEEAYAAGQLSAEDANPVESAH
jgi:Ni/Fe-hydrogenase subunit HybB-like protein